MSKNNPDKQLNRFSAIIEIITNLGTIGSWILGAGSAYVLNIQKFPVIVPGINFTLDLNFQFALIICSILAYVHYLQTYWNSNKEKMSLSNSFADFSLWELPRLKRPLLLIPVVMIIAVCAQISAKSYWLLSILLLLLGILIYFIYKRFRYHLSPSRKHEIWMKNWFNDAEWIERWFRRINSKLEKYGNVTVRDLYEVGLTNNEQDNLEIEFALGQYFNKYEFQEDLVLIRTYQLHREHPERTWGDNTHQWILLQRENLKLRTNTEVG